MRELPLQEFILGNRKIDLQPSEMVIGLRIPEESTNGQSIFLKLGARKYLVISISAVAARLVCNSAGIIEHSAISVGGVFARCNPFNGAGKGYYRHEY